MRYLIQSIVIWLLALPVQALEAPTPLDYLNKMAEAHRTLNYEQIYVLQEGDEAVSWRYRHAQSENKRYAQLLKLDNARQEIILQHNQIGYFGEFAPFSLQAEQILDNLPSVIYTDFNRLQGYTMLDLGRSRVANRVARIIRLLPNDDFRYQYLLWIDEETHLLLKSELLDRDKNRLEEFRVLKSSVDDELQEIIEPISELVLPTQVEAKSDYIPPMNWKPKWLPKGFELKSSGRPSIHGTLSYSDFIESQFYSDGLFSFTIYLADNKGVPFEEQFWRDGKTSVYSQTVGDNDVIIIGEIPIASARHILQEIEFNLPLEEEKNAAQAAEKEEENPQ